MYFFSYYVEISGLSTLRTWANKIDIHRGVLNSVLKLLEISGKGMSHNEKIVVLQFDEIKIAEKIEYDIKTDQIIGPHKQFQIVQARGLFAKWKQPIYCEFDQKITKEILFNLIIKLANIGFRVVACVNDCGPTNMALWNGLGVCKNKTWIEHPTMENKNIFFFADVPHLLKLVRNWLLDTGFLLENGKEIGKIPLQVRTTL